MKTSLASIHFKDNSFLISNFNILTDIGNDFLKLTGYSKDEVVDKEISEVFINLLRLPHNTFERIELEGKIDCFLFTKSLNAKEVIITFFKGKDSNERVYRIAEKPNSSLESNLPLAEKLLSDNRISIGIFSVPDLILLKANQSYIDIVSEPLIQTRTIIGLSLKEIIPWWEGSKEEIAFIEMMKTGNSLYFRELEGLINHKQNTFFDNNLLPIAVNGRVKFIISMVENVTEKVVARRRIEEQSNFIQQQKEHLEAIIENISDGLCEINKNNNYTFLNQAGKDFFYQSDTIANHGDSFCHTKYFDENGRELPVEDMVGPKVFRGERVKNYKITAKRPDKTLHFSLNGSPMIEKDGSISLAIISCRDITEQIETDQIVSRQKEQVDAIIENMSDALFIFDKHGKFMALNKGARDYLKHQKNADGIEQGYSSHDFYNMSNEKISFEKMPSSQVLQGNFVIDKHMRVKNEYREVFISANGTPIYDSNGEFLLGVVSYRDITEHIHADRMKDDFLSLISHELRTPLSVIISAIQAMEFICKNELTDKAKEFIGKIRQNSLRQLRLINNLLDITRINAGYIKLNRKNHDIVYHTKMIFESVYSYSQQKGLNLSFTSSFKKKVIGLDEEKYERILLNLLSNAIKFTPMGKKILVALSCYKGLVCIKVKDEGIGIPKGKQNLIFERFGQVDSSLSRQAEGSGIGLSLVKMLVEALSGSISVKSASGAGSTFIIYLPNEKIVEDSEEKSLQELTDNRLVQATASEFSDIYLH